MADAPDGSEPGALVGGYEAMRHAVVSGEGEAWRHGYAVLANRGMAAWMAACTAVASAPAAGTPAPSDPSSPTPPRPSVDPAAPTLSSLRNAGEIVAVLAQMALVHV